MLNAVSATWAILRRPILVAFYDTHMDTEDILDLNPRVPTGVKQRRTPFMTIFFNAVKQNCPDVQVLRLMSDDDEAGINATNSVFGKHVKHYLCKWHVTRAWKRRLASAG